MAIPPYNLKIQLMGLEIANKYCDSSEEDNGG
jgi:hypothetical protein